jgi:hypothetical protein|tara:strand:+ start:274 stop:429 length:156 start_codon:yes stop_codon:yes gene_type:complete
MSKKNKTYNVCFDSKLNKLNSKQLLAFYNGKPFQEALRLSNAMLINKNSAK